MPDRRPFMITTAIPYANGAPHIGHAYERIAADAMQRFMRLDGRDVFFVTGTDEHGLKMLQTAQREGITVEALGARVSGQFLEMAELLNTRSDDFVRTTEARHLAACTEFWRRSQANGDIYLSRYEGWYSVRDEAYYDAEEVVEGADGKKLSPQGTPIEWVAEESYFFRLSAYSERLLAFYEANPTFVTPDKYFNEIKAFVKRGLADVSISRTTFNWGVPVPGDPKHVMYVWFDALINYITACGYPDLSGPRGKFWPADVHVIGKDITRFHAIYWPAFLLSAGAAPPRQIVVHGFLFSRGEKMSKSVGNVISPATLAADYGVDPLRYFFLREVPYGQDGNYSHEAIVNRINADLANDLGNLAQRSLSMIAKNCNGAMPAPGEFTAADTTMLADAEALAPRARASMQDFLLHTVLADIWKIVADANRYFAGEEPWKLTKTNPARRDTVLYVTAQTLRVIAILAQPFMPASANKLLDLLAVPQTARTFAHADAAHRTEAGSVLPAPAPIFPRYVEPEEGASGPR